MLQDYMVKKCMVIYVSNKLPSQIYRFHEYLLFSSTKPNITTESCLISDKEKVYCSTRSLRKYLHLHVCSNFPTNSSAIAS